MATKETIDLIQAGTRYLAGCCDGAITWDGRGFNKVDSLFGKSLADQKNWTNKQILAARKMLIHYKGQLQMAGYDVEEMLNGELNLEPEAPKPVAGTDSQRPNLKKALVQNGRITIQFPFDWETVGLVKTIPGKRFHHDAYPKYWSAPLSIEAAEILSKNGFDLAPEVAALLEKKAPAIENVKDIPAADLKLKRELFDFQKKGLAFIESRNGRALVGDEMGLGKTIQAIAWLGLHPEKRPAIVVCPAHLKLNWVKEIRMTLPGNPNIQVIQGTDTTQALTGDILIINYDILHNKYDDKKKEIPHTGWVDFLIDLKPQVVIMDEAHYCKTSKALRTKATRKLASKAKHVIALTGTPIVNRPVEGFTIFQMIDRNLFPNFWDYTKRYCDAKHNGFGWDFTGASNKEELHERLQAIMIRRKKAEVLPDLPDKLYSYVPMEMDDANEYFAAEADFIRYLRGTKGTEAAAKASRAEHLTRIEALKQLAVKGKIKQAIQWIRDFLDTNGNKLVVFAVHKTTIDLLMKEFGKEAVKVDGSVSSVKRDEAVVAFQNDPAIKLFVGNIQAAGTGLTLTAASSVAFLELPWTPGELKQAEDRCHRIGQKNTVNVYYLLADQTIEAKIAGILDGKREVLEAILDGKEVEEATLLSELMNAYISKEEK